MRADCGMPAEPLFEPTAQTRHKLRQYGFRNGQINDRLNEYRKLSRDCSDRGFSQFCLRADRGLMASLVTLKISWSPSKTVAAELDGWGLSPPVQWEYLSLYRREYAEQQILQSSWDEHFLNWCRIRWSHDNRNPEAEWGTYMSSDWLPSRETLDQLISEGMDGYWLDTLAMEFRLYWNEVGARKISWNKQFLWWARRQWHQQYSRESAG